MLLILLGLLVVACLSLAGLWYLFTRPGQNEPVGALATTAAETIQAAITQNAAATALAQGQPHRPWSPRPPRSQSTARNAIPTAPTACEKASFIADVTIPDNTVMYPLTPFTKIWRIRNDSPCTWDERYSLVFSKGAALNQAATSPFPGKVAPGQQVTYSSTWSPRLLPALTLPTGCCARLRMCSSA